jgi:tRNA pseudouridine55 synthase
VRLRNGNPGEVLATDAGFGDVAWASFEGRAVAIGRYMSGLLHPDRVFALAGSDA